MPVILGSMAGRSFTDLAAKGVLGWPRDIAQREQNLSIIPQLIETQEKFISLLHLADKSPVAWKEVLNVTTGLSANMFVKHLMVLSDVGGEKLKNCTSEIRRAFPGDELHYSWNEQAHRYTFKTLGRQNWSNQKLFVDGPGLQVVKGMTDALEDVAMLILFGASDVRGKQEDWISDRCGIGALLGQKEELATFVRQRYIWVSRITGGATANALGQLAQQMVRDKLVKHLPDWSFSRHNIPGISHNAGDTNMSFDIVAKSPSGGFCAIEVSFQVTTNSVIERKSGQAEARQQNLHKGGHKIAYVIDGSGNFYRRNAISRICRFSDCTVTFADSEIASLAEFIRKNG